MVADIVGFTEISSRTSPRDIVSLLNQLFSTFDELCTKYGLEKIKTVGDAYIAVGGIPVAHPYHAQVCTSLSSFHIVSLFPSFLP